MLLTIRRGAAGLLAALLVGAGIPATTALAEPVTTITFVRHGESQGNASGIIDTSVPGPPLTATGENQAKEAAVALSGDPHDGIYASTMIRTQQTAQPLADAIGEPVAVLPGLREIEAGDFEGRSGAEAMAGYFGPLQEWITGNRFARIPGSIDGNEFDVRFDAAIDTVYRSGQHNPVVFSHGGAIALWTTMNVHNPRPELGRV